MSPVQLSVLWVGKENVMVYADIHKTSSQLVNGRYISLTFEQSTEPCCGVNGMLDSMSQPGCTLSSKEYQTMYLSRTLRMECNQANQLVRNMVTYNQVDCFKLMIILTLTVTSYQSSSIRHCFCIITFLHNCRKDFYPNTKKTFTTSDMKRLTHQTL